MKTKNFLITCMILVLAVSSVGASYTFPSLFNEGQSFSPTSVRSEGMGGSGLATSRGLESIYINPANLAQQRFALSMPSISLSAYNVKNIIDEGIIQDVLDGNAGEATALAYLDTIVAAKGELLTTDIQMGFAGGGFGLSLDLQEKLHNIDVGADTNIIAEINASAAVAIAFSLPLIDDLLTVDAGAVVRPTYTAYTQRIGAQNIINSAFSEGSDILQQFLEDNQLAAGYAVPVDVGVNVNGPLGVRLSAVARNLNGVYTMYQYSEAGTWLNEMLALVEAEPVYTGTSSESTELTIEVPWSLDLGLGWDIPLGSLSSLVRPTISVDLVDVATLQETLADDPDAVWDHLIAGAELRILSMLDARFGLNKGYMSIGAGFDLLLFHIDAAYYWREFGANIGDRPVDALTVRFNFGIDG
ncbi:MAG: hypothetical protein JXK93_13670 [Sphaerochaetaceae bacterium]|nr:hypothetical protein [Sphaerochaetaceae bacterium]